VKNKVFITGLTGMVGSHLADFLLKKTKFKIYGLCRWNSKLNNIFHLGKYIKNKRLNIVNGDLLDENSINNALKRIKPKYIFHLAAHSYPTTSFTSPKETLSTNIIGTLNILESIRLLNLKKVVVHICSSSEVFGKVDKKNIPIKEENSYHPASPYAISKVGTDLLGKYYADAYGINTQITRMFTHTGPRRSEFFAESTFAKQIVMIEKKIVPPIIYVGNVKSLRTICDVRDAVRAYYMLVTKNPIPGSTYNIGGSYSCTIEKLLRNLIRLSKIKNKNNIKIKIDKNRIRPIDADLQVPSIKKFVKHTGWKPQISFDKTCNDLLDYWRKEIDKTSNYFNR
tara:strand:+ start:2783 stop:3802 length:1020 start_codon:yes stop_codon:yes gene_type:complete